MITRRKKSLLLASKKIREFETKISKERWTNGDLNPGPFTCAHVRSENHTPRPFAPQLHYFVHFQIYVVEIYPLVPLESMIGSN